MTRRALFSLLAGGAAVAADPERLLWTPGKLISIPAPRPKVFTVTVYPMTQLHSQLHAQYLSGIPGELVTVRGMQYWVSSQPPKLVSHGWPKPHLKPGDRVTFAWVFE